MGKTTSSKSDKCKCSCGGEGLKKCMNIHSMDMFDQPIPGFNHRGDETKSSNCGFFFTVFVWALMIYITLTWVTKWAIRDDPLIIESTTPSAFDGTERF